MDTIVIFAAGKGTRMGNITNATPKPLIKIKNKPLLQYSLELTKLHAFDRIIINTHHLHTQIEEFVEQFRRDNPVFPMIILEHEEVLLETAGTIKKLQGLYGLNERIFTLNSDVIIRHNGNVFARMIEVWEEKSPDILLLLQDTHNAFGYTGKGDFELERDGSVSRNGDGPFPYMFAGMHLLDPVKVSRYADDISSLREFYPGIGKVAEKLKVRGLSMDGLWYHATSPQDIENIESSI